MKTLQQALPSAKRKVKICREKRGKKSATEKNAIASTPAAAGFHSLMGEVPCNAHGEEAMLTKYLLILHRTELVPHTVSLQSVGPCTLQGFHPLPIRIVGLDINVNNTERGGSMEWEEI